MRKMWKVLGVLLVALVVLGVSTVGATPPEDLHCPEGWLAKVEFSPSNWERADGVTGSFGVSHSGAGGLLRGITSITSSDYTLTGFCVKAGRGNTGFLPMSELPWLAEEHDISHIVIYGERESRLCDEVVAGDKVFGDYYPLGDPVWNDWVIDGDTRTRTGRQLFQRDWYQLFYDAENREHICDVLEGSQKVGRLLRDYEDTPCIGMYMLVGYNYPCYLNRNPATDVQWNLPERFGVGGTITSYAQGLCNQVYTCDGWTTGNFQYTGEWVFVCEYEECLDCE